MTWRALFDTADTIDVTVDEIRTALAAHRANDQPDGESSAPDDGESSAPGEGDDA